jgi:multidrug resistance efflux pump
MRGATATARFVGKEWAMRNDSVWDLADSTEFRQTLLARPPGIVHGTVFLLVLVLGTALVWAAVTEADLVVRAAGGQVRPVNPPRQVFLDFSGDLPSTSLGIAVVAVKYQQGDVVKEGAELILLDTKRLDYEIGKLRLTIAEGEKELAQLTDQATVLAHQCKKTQLETEAERTQAEQEIQRDQAKQVVDVSVAQAKWKNARQELDRAKKLYLKSSIAREVLEKLEAQAAEAKGDLERAELPVLDDKVKVLTRKLERLEADYGVKVEDLRQKQLLKHKEVESARIDLAKSQREREQAIVRAPITGVVISREVKVGDIPDRTKPVVEIAEENSYRFEVEVSNEDVALLREGMSARIKVDAYDYQKYGILMGKVSFVAPDAKAAEGSRTAKYLVKIDLEAYEVGLGDNRGRIKLGMTGQADIVTDQESLLSLMVRRVRQTISLG